MNSRGWKLLLGGAVLLVALGYLTARLSAPSSGGEQPRPDTTATASPVTTIAIAGGKPVLIEPGKYVFYYFQLPSGACTLTGHFQSVGGDNSNFDTLLFDEANFKKWSAGRRAKSVGSGPVVVWSPNISLTGPGAYYLVVRSLYAKAMAVAIQAEAGCPK